MSFNLHGHASSNSIRSPGENERDSPSSQVPTSAPYRPPADVCGTQSSVARINDSQNSNSSFDSFQNQQQFNQQLQNRAVPYGGFGTSLYKDINFVQSAQSSSPYASFQGNNQQQLGQQPSSQYGNHSQPFAQNQQYGSSQPSRPFIQSQPLGQPQGQASQPLVQLSSQYGNHSQPFAQNQQYGSSQPSQLFRQGQSLPFDQSNPLVQSHGNQSQLKQSQGQSSHPTSQYRNQSQAQPSKPFAQSQQFGSQAQQQYNSQQSLPFAQNQQGQNAQSQQYGSQQYASSQPSQPLGKPQLFIQNQARGQSQQRQPFAQNQQYGSSQPSLPFIQSQPLVQPSSQYGNHSQPFAQNQQYGSSQPFIQSQPLGQPQGQASQPFSQSQPFGQKIIREDRLVYIRTCRTADGKYDRGTFIIFKNRLAVLKPNGSTSYLTCLQKSISTENKIESPYTISPKSIIDVVHLYFQPKDWESSHNSKDFKRFYKERYSWLPNNFTLCDYGIQVFKETQTGKSHLIISDIPITFNRAFNAYNLQESVRIPCGGNDPFLNQANKKLKLFDWDKGDICLISFSEITNDLLEGFQKNKEYRAIFSSSDYITIPVQFRYSKDDYPNGSYVEPLNLTINKTEFSSDVLKINEISPEAFYGVFRSYHVSWKDLEERDSPWKECEIISVEKDGVKIVYQDDTISKERFIKGFCNVYQSLKVTDNTPIIFKNVSLHHFSLALEIKGKNLSEDTFLSFSIKKNDGTLIDPAHVREYITISENRFFENNGDSQTFIVELKWKDNSIGKGCMLLCRAISKEKKSIKPVQVCTLGLEEDSFDGLVNKLPHWKTFADSAPLLSLQPKGSSWKSRIGKYGFFNPRAHYLKEKESYENNTTIIPCNISKSFDNDDEDEINDTAELLEDLSISYSTLLDCDISHYLLSTKKQYDDEFKTKPFIVKFQRRELPHQDLNSIEELKFFLSKHNAITKKLIKQTGTEDEIILSFEFPWKEYEENKANWSFDKPWRLEIVTKNNNIVLNSCVYISQDNFKSKKAKPRYTKCPVNTFTILPNEGYYNISIPKSADFNFKENSLKNSKYICIFSPSYQRKENATLDYSDIMESIPYLHFIVVRNNEFKDYYDYWGNTHIIISLPQSIFSNDIKKRVSCDEGGVGFTRNYIYDCAKHLGVSRYWMIDDNISQFYIVASNQINVEPCSFAEVVTNFETMFTSSKQKTEFFKKDVKVYDNTYIREKTKSTCFDVYSDGPKSHLQSCEIEENRLSIEIQPSEGENLTVEEFTGPSDRYAVIGLRQYSKIRVSPYATFSRTHCSCAILVNVDAIEKVNSNLPPEKKIAFPLYPLAEDLKFNDRCDFHGLWICRSNRYQFIKPQTRKKADNWKNNHLTYFRLKYDNGEKNLPYIQLKDYKLIPTDDISKGIIIPLRKYGTCFNLKESVMYHPSFAKYLKNDNFSISISLKGGLHKVPLQGEESSIAVLKLIGKNEISSNSIVELIISSEPPIFKAIIPTTFVRIRYENKEYNQYEKAEIFIECSPNSNTEIQLIEYALGKELSKQSKTLSGDNKINILTFFVPLYNHGIIQFIAKSNQQEAYTANPDTISINVNQSHNDERNVFTNYQLTFGQIMFSNKMKQYFEKHNDVKETFQELINYYGIKFDASFRGKNILSLMVNDKIGIRLVQVLSYIAVRKFYQETNNPNIHPVICLPTGMGKSLTALLLPFQNISKTVFIVTPTLAILRGYQNYFLDEEPSLLVKCGLLTEEAFKKLNVLFWLTKCKKPFPSNCSNIDDPQKQDKIQKANYVIITFQSLSKLAVEISKYCQPDMLIFDESHHTSADSYGTIRKYFPSSKIVGLSATPTSQTIGENFNEKLTVIFRVPVDYGMFIGEIKQLKLSLLSPNSITIEKNNIPNYPNYCYNCYGIMGDSPYNENFCSMCSPSHYIRINKERIGIKIPSGIIEFVESGTGSKNEGDVDKFFYKFIFNKEKLSRENITNNSCESGFRNLIISPKCEILEKNSITLIHVIEESIKDLDIRYQTNAQDPQAIIICEKIEFISHLVSIYSKIIEQKYIKKEISKVFSVGSANEPENINLLLNGKLNIIIQCKKLSEGFDHKPLSVAVILQPIRSLKPFYQVS